MITLFLSTLLLFPFALHPPIGFIVTKLVEGKKWAALLLALGFGLFYDLSLNHLSFGLFTLFFVGATLVVESSRKLLFLGKMNELFFLSLVFAGVVQAGEVFFMKTRDASFVALFTSDALLWSPFYEAAVSLIIFGVFPLLKKFRMKTPEYSS